jgi:iron complex outermembrane receptor protein
LVGAYYFKQSSENDFGFLDNGRFTRYTTNLNDSFESTSKAVFGNVTFEVVDGLRILGGLRYNDDGQVLIGGADGGGGEKTLWRAGLEYDVNPDVMLYATASTGYRVGGVNGAGAVAAGAPPVFDAENVTAYEAGFKSQFMDRTLTLNGSFFYNRFRNMHAQSFVTACINPAVPASCIATEFTSNGGEIDSKGVELEFNWLPGDNFFLNGSVAYLDAKFGDYLVARVNGLGNFEGRQDVTRTRGEIVAAGGVPSLQLDGWRPALSPEFTMALQSGYIFDIDEDNSITPMAQLSFSSQYWSFDYNVPGSEQDAFAKLDLRLTWRDKSRGLMLEGFIENVTNQAVLVRSVIFTPDEANLPSAAIQANYGDPRIWGVRLGLDF